MFVQKSKPFLTISWFANCSERFKRLQQNLKQKEELESPRELADKLGKCGKTYINSFQQSHAICNWVGCNFLQSGSVAIRWEILSDLLVVVQSSLVGANAGKSACKIMQCFITFRNHLCFGAGLLPPYQRWKCAKMWKSWWVGNLLAGCFSQTVAIDMFSSTMVPIGTKMDWWSMKHKISMFWDFL